MFYFGSQWVGWYPAILGRAMQSALPNPLIHILISSRNILTNISRMFSQISRLLIPQWRYHITLIITVGVYVWVCVCETERVIQGNHFHCDIVHQPLAGTCVTDGSEARTQMQGRKIRLGVNCGEGTKTNAEIISPKRGLRNYEDTSVDSWILVTFCIPMKDISENNGDQGTKGLEGWRSWASPELREDSAARSNQSWPLLLADQVEMSEKRSEEVANKTQRMIFQENHFIRPK